MTLGSRVKVPMHGTGTIVQLGNIAEFPKTATAVVQFDSGKRYVVLAKRMRGLS